MSTEGRKFFFDVNNFDGASSSKPEDDIPPPPVFSEEELETAKQAAFEEGRLEGHKQEQQTRAQYIATQISELNTQILSLILSEQMREKKFEQDVLHLCRAIIQKIFPSLTVLNGYNEIETIITRVLENQTASKIHIEVLKDDADDIKTYLLSLKDIAPDRLHITGADDLNKGSCRMKWEDGGAIRDHEALSAKVFAELDEILAPLPQKVQNSESIKSDIKENIDNGEENG